MKLLSVTVPCYNSEAYMKKCVNSLLKGGEEVEIIIVDDGSSDSTPQIADELAAKYPTIIKAVHQENGGHGEAVNTGLKNASGVYFKVVDSDDCVAKDAYIKLLDIMRDTVEKNIELDMLISNFVYDKQGAKLKRIMKYTNVMPVDSYFTWDDVGHFRPDQYILMHSVIYRTKLLLDCGFILPKHTFYVDNIFVFQPLPYVKTMYYADVIFYKYFIGREDQSVNQDVMIKRVDQQIRVNKIMIDYFDYDKMPCKKCKIYMQNYLDIMMTVSSIMLILSKEKVNLEKKKELWHYLKETNPKLYKHLRHTALGIGLNLPGAVGRKISVTGYKIAQKLIGFN